jgi:hypothetical protein
MLGRAYAELRRIYLLTAVCSAVGPIQTATGIRTDAYRVAKMLGCGDT